MQRFYLKGLHQANSPMNMKQAIYMQTQQNKLPEMEQDVGGASLIRD